MITFRQEKVPGGTMKRTLVGLFCALSLAILTPMGTRAADKLCANALFPAPTMDGELDSDSGWIKANELTFNNGLLQQYGYARLRMGTEGGNLWLSIRVNHQDPNYTFNPQDTIILMFGPTGANGTFQKIAIYPVDAAGAATAVPGDPPKDAQYWEASSGSNTISWTAKPRPSWLQDAQGNIINIKVMASSAAVPDKWYQLEMRFPIAVAPSNGLVLPQNGDFRMYVNTIRWHPDPDNPGGSISPEVDWPPEASLTYGDVNNTPPPDQWGLASLAGPCSGVHVNGAYTNNQDTNSVNVNSTNNIFTIEITNSGSAASGRVQAELKAARFGLPGPGLYGHVPWPGNPTTTPAGINPGLTVSVSSLPWDLVHDPNRAQYVQNPYLCSKVELSAISGVNTLISNRYFYWNMHFSTASKFTHTAILDATGYPKRRDGKQQQFVLMVSTADDLARPITAKLTTNQARIREQLTRNITTSLRNDARLMRASSFLEKGRLFRKFVCGYRRTGEFITIKGKTAEVVEPANCYGYLIAHVGPIVEWRHSLQGKNIRPARAKIAIPSGAYSAVLAEGQSMPLVTEVEAVERRTGDTGALLERSLAGTIACGLLVIGLAAYWPSRRKSTK